MTLLVIFIFVLLLIFSVRFRCVVMHPHLTVYYAVKDTYKYIRYREWRKYKKYGKLTIYTGLFGRGKTLTLSKKVRNIYKKYNNKKVYDFKDKKWKYQHINVVSNIILKDINYIELTSMQDMLLFSEDRWNNGVDIWLFVIDEMSTQLNSREYKNNFTTELLNILLTCRHYRFEIIGSSQRFNHVDALVRQVTSTADECYKIWRTCTIDVYNAWTIENTTDVSKIKPVSRTCYFITDKDYESYDTSAVVNNFKDNVIKGNVLTDKEILEYQQLQSDSSTDIYLKRRKRKKQHD